MKWKWWEKKEKPVDVGTVSTTVVVPRASKKIEATSVAEFSGTHGCRRCGFDGAIKSKYMSGGSYEQPDGGRLEVIGVHLARWCPWCESAWIEQCYPEGATGPSSALVVNQPQEPKSTIQPSEDTPVYA